MNASKAFLAIHIIVGFKKQPNMKSYWEKLPSIFCCHVISNIITLARFRKFKSHLYITNLAIYEHIERNNDACI